MIKEYGLLLAFRPYSARVSMLPSIGIVSGKKYSI